MKSLLVNSFLLAFFLSLLSCATSRSQYEILKVHRFTDGQIGGVELLATPDRIKVECEDVSEENDLFGFMIHIINHENKYVTLIHGATLEKKACEWKMKGVNNVIASGSVIYFFGMGRFRINEADGDFPIEFPQGTIKSSKQSLQFQIAKNEKSDCFDTNGGNDWCSKVGVDFFEGAVPAKWP